MNAIRSFWEILLCAVYTAAPAETWQFEVPPTALLERRVEEDWREVSSLSLTVQWMDPVETVQPLLAFYVQTAEGLWLESRSDLVLDGSIQRFELSLLADSLDWRLPTGDRMYGPDLLRNVESWGLRLYAPEPLRGLIRTGPLVKKFPAEPKPFFPVLRGLPEEIRVGQPLRLEVEATDWKGDPFEVQRFVEVEIAEEKIRPRLAWVQEYRTRAVPGRIRPVRSPWGRPVFRGWWIPEQAGEAVLRLPDGSEQRVQVQPREDLMPRKPERVRGSDTSGTEYWRWDPEQREWMPTDPVVALRTRLDWTDAWGMYAGLGEFMQPLAMELEKELVKDGPPAAFVLVSEEILNNRTDFNWQDHPWNLINGGRLNASTGMWEDPEWGEMILRRAAYVVARYAGHPRFQGLVLEVNRADPARVEWIQHLTDRISEEFPGVSVFCPSPGLPLREEGPRLTVSSSGWEEVDGLRRADQLIAGEEPVQVLAVGPQQDGLDLSVPRMQHWSTAEVLQLDVEPDFSSDGNPRIQVHVRTSPDRVFGSRTVPLHNREINRLFLPLDDPEFWTCFQNPDREWSPLERMNIREVILRVFSENTDPTDEFQVHGVREVSHPVRIRSAPPPLAFGEQSVPPESVRQLELQEWIFTLNRHFRNPYDPEEIAVDLEVKLPDGTTVEHPGFFYHHTRRDYNEGVESWSLEHQADWRVRFRPWMAGRHRWTLRVRSGGEEIVRSGQFEAAEAPDARGFLQISEQDPRYFEFQNGDFFYPLGHTMRSPSDRRSGIYEPPVRKALLPAEKKGTQIYAEWFRKMEAAGGNYARIWISNWWLGLEWNSRHSGYHGKRYFNQLNAARLDRVVELAEKHGMILNLETTNHGTFSSGTDAEWVENPWSSYSVDEGPVPYASEFFTHEEGLRWHRNKMRYLIARVGHSSAVGLWGVITETEWTEAYDRSRRNIRENRLRPYHPTPYRSDDYREPLKQWVQETAEDFHTLNAHPVTSTTHFSNPGNGLDFWKLHALQVIYNNAYSGFYRSVRPPLERPSRLQPGVDYPLYRGRKEDPWGGIVREIFGYGFHFGRHAKGKKMVLVGEWGGRPSSNRDSHLIAEFHAGTWAAVMSDLAGVGGFWWFNLVDYHDLFPRYAAVHAFMSGEDLRGSSFVSGRWPVRFPDQPSDNRRHIRQALGKTETRKAFLYVYSSALSHGNNAVPPEGVEDRNFPPSGKGWAAVPDRLEDGIYTVSYWNTFTGEVLGRERVVLHPENREIPIPPHRVDIALKITYEGMLPPPTPTPVPTPTPIPTPTPVPTPLPTPTPAPMPSSDSAVEAEPNSDGPNAPDPE